MQTYFLSVLRPLTTPGPAHHVLHVYRLGVSMPLQWVREHADDIAQRLHGTNYTALMVSETEPD